MAIRCVLSMRYRQIICVLYVVCIELCVCQFRGVGWEEHKLDCCKSKHLLNYCACFPLVTDNKALLQYQFMDRQFLDAIFILVCLSSFASNWSRLTFESSRQIRSVSLSICLSLCVWHGYLSTNNPCIFLKFFYSIFMLRLK